MVPHRSFFPVRTRSATDCILPHFRLMAKRTSTDVSLVVFGWAISTARFRSLRQNLGWLLCGAYAGMKQRYFRR